MLVNWNPSKGNPKEYKLGYTDYFVDYQSIEKNLRVVSERFQFTESDEQAIQELAVQQKIADEEQSRIWQEALKNKTPVPLQRKNKLPLHGQFRCNYHVSTVATLTLEQASRLLFVTKRDDKHHRSEIWIDYEPQELRVQIVYPLSKIVEATIPPYQRIWIPSKKFKEKGGERRERSCLDPGYLMWIIARVYDGLYDKYEEYGIWGHTMGDLYFEGFDIWPDGRTVMLMGS